MSERTRDSRVLSKCVMIRRVPGCCILILSALDWQFNTNHSPVYSATFVHQSRATFTTQIYLHQMKVLNLALSIVYIICFPRSLIFVSLGFLQLFCQKSSQICLCYTARSSAVLSCVVRAINKCAFPNQRTLSEDRAKPRAFREQKTRPLVCSFPGVGYVCRQ